MIKRLEPIQPIIVHIKTDGRVERNSLKKALGRAMNYVLCGEMYNPPDTQQAAASLCQNSATDYGVSISRISTNR